MPLTWPSPRLVAACRIALGVAVILNAIEIATVLNRVANGALASPRSVDLPVVASMVQTWTLIAVTAGAFVALGIITHVAALAASATCLFAMVWDQQAYTNHFWLTTLLLIPL